MVLDVVSVVVLAVVLDVVLVVVLIVVLVVVLVVVSSLPRSDVPFQTCQASIQLSNS